MDPDANIREQFRLAMEIQDDEFASAREDRLSDLILALIEWKAKGGFSPDYSFHG